MGDPSVDHFVFELFNPIHMALVFFVLGLVHCIRLREKLPIPGSKIPQTQARIVTCWSFAFIWAIWYVDLHWTEVIPLDYFRAIARIFVWLLAAMEIAYYLDEMLVVSGRWYKRFLQVKHDDVN